MYDPDFIWAIDDGDPSHVKHFDEVIINTLGSTNENSDSKINPMSWVEFYDATLREDDGVAYLEDGLPEEEPEDPR
jgi:hypothetical protein